MNETNTTTETANGTSKHDILLAQIGVNEQKRVEQLAIPVADERNRAANAVRRCEKSLTAAQKVVAEQDEALAKYAASGDDDDLALFGV